jgi:hypothetical protein
MERFEGEPQITSPPLDPLQYPKPLIAGLAVTLY